MKQFNVLSISLVLFVWNLSTGNAQTEIPKGINDLLTLHTCYTCHKPDTKFIGPSWQEISAKGMKKAEVIAAIYAPDPSRWPGYPPMVGMPQVPKKDIEKIADWIVKLKAKSAPK